MKALFALHLVQLECKTVAFNCEHFSFVAIAMGICQLTVTVATQQTKPVFLVLIWQENLKRTY